MEVEESFIDLQNSNFKDFIAKKTMKLIEQDKQNVRVQSPSISIKTMTVGENLALFVEVGSNLRLRKELARQFFQRQNPNQPTRVIFGLWGHQQSTDLKNQMVSSNQLLKNLFNLNILIKLKAQQYPYISMFAADCTLNILRMYLKNAKIKDEVKIRWKNDIFLGNKKIGQIMTINDLKGQQVFSNIAIRLKLDYFTKDPKHFAMNLLQQFAGRLSISMNLRETALKIKQQYQRSLMYIGQTVDLKRKKGNLQQILTGKFVGVNNVGSAILEGIDIDDAIEEGTMTKKQNQIL